MEARRLSTVMFLDMVGYSALMARDERSALAKVSQMEALVGAAVRGAGGRVVKLLGDGTLAEFPSAVAALRCAKLVLAQDEVKLRVGIHLGEVIDRDGDIFGDAVNVAARIQPIADPGGVAMSEVVYAQLRNQEPLVGTLLPPQKLKNIPRPMPVFVIPPPSASRLWRARRHLRARRGLVIGVSAVLIAAGFVRLGAVRGRDLAAAAKPTEQGTAAPPARPAAGVRMTLIYTLTKGDDPEQKRFAADVEQEFDMGGSQLKGVHWLWRPWVLGQFSEKGVKDLTAIERGEKGSCEAAHQMGLRFPVMATVRRDGNGWALDGAVMDVEDLTVVGNFHAKGQVPKELAQQALIQLQAWAESTGKQLQ